MPRLNPTGKDKNVIIGTPDTDVIFGTERDDIIEGRAGFDRLEGLGGNDILRGQNGGDALNGGAGKDVLVGGQGFDHFRFDRMGSEDADVVRDYTRGEDDIMIDSAHGPDFTMTGSYDNFVNADVSISEIGGGTAYDVIVLSYVEFSDIAAAEDAIAAQSTTDKAGMFLYMDSTDEVAKLVYDSDIDADNNLTDANLVATFTNLTELSDIKLMATGDFGFF